MTKKQKNKVKIVGLFAACLAISQPVKAMHIMEGYLPPMFCIAWGVLCIPFLLTGFYRIQRIIRENRKSITILAIAGAYVFVISALKIPSLTGSCSHMTGTGLGAILLGPSTVGILGIMVLLFQAILLAHGGLTTLGANTFSMAVAGPLITYGIYRLCKKAKVNKRVSIFVAAAFGDLATYCVTSIQLALAYPSRQGGVLASAVEFLGVFAVTQIPLALVEGSLTVMIVMALEHYANPELKSIGFVMGKE